MSTMDEIAKAEDELANALSELASFKNDPAHWSYRQEKSELDGRFHKKVADLSPAYFPQLEHRQKTVEVAEQRLRQVKREWLRGVI